MTEDRAAYRENRAELNSQLHSKRKPSGNGYTLQKEEYRSDVREKTWSKFAKGAQRGCKISLLGEVRT